MIPINVKKYKERQTELITKLEGMVQTCQTETRSFNEAEQGEYASIMQELRSIEDTLGAAGVVEASQKKVDKPAGGTEQRSQEEVESRAFECYIRGIAPDVETRAAVNMTTGDNGAVIPTSIANKIIEKVIEISPLFSMATRYNVGGTLNIPKYDESTQKITMAYAAEFSALTSTAGKTTSISLSGFLAGALSKVSISLVNNSKFDIVSFVICKMAEAAADWIENELINGTASKIEGLSSASAAVTTAASTAITSDELIDLQDSVPDKLQDGCIWLMTRKTRSAIRKLKDGDGNYLLQKDFTSKWGYTLLGKPVYTSKNMPEIAAGKKPVFYLDPKGLAVKVAENPSVQVLREKFADEHAIGVICWLEMDAKIENDQMVAAMAMKAATQPGGLREEQAVMKYKATVSFAGEITMGRGEVRDVSDDIAAPLVSDGYLEPEKEAGGQADPPDRQEELESLTKDVLSQKAEELGVDVKSNWNKVDIINAILEAESAGSDT